MWHIAEWAATIVGRVNDIAAVARTIGNEPLLCERADDRNIRRDWIAWVSHRAFSANCGIHNTMAEVAIDAIEVFALELSKRARC